MELSCEIGRKFDTVFLQPDLYKAAILAILMQEGKVFSFKLLLIMILKGREMNLAIPLVRLFEMKSKPLELLGARLFIIIIISIIEGEDIYL